MIERDDAFVGIKDVPAKGNKWVNSGTSRARKRSTCHLSHCTPGFVISAVSVFGRDPPEMATVNRWRLSIASF